MKMNLLRPYWISSNFKTFFPLTDFAWIGTKLIGLNMYYDSNFVQNYEPIISPELGIDARKITKSNCSLLKIGQKLDFQRMFRLNIEPNCHVDRFTTICQRPLEGSWSSWTEWSKCSCYKKNNILSKQTRYRKCDDPPPVSTFKIRPCKSPFSLQTEQRLCKLNRKDNKIIMEVVLPSITAEEDICKSFTKQDLKTNKVKSKHHFHYGVKRLIVTLKKKKAKFNLLLLPSTCLGKNV